MARLLVLGIGALAVTLAPLVGADLPSARPAGELELVATFDGPMPTSVTVSHKGRVFVNYPRWGDPVTFTVAEVKSGAATAYPDEAAFATFDRSRPGETLVSVHEAKCGPAVRVGVGLRPLLASGCVKSRPASTPCWGQPDFSGPVGSAGESVGQKLLNTLGRVPGI